MPCEECNDQAVKSLQIELDDLKTMNEETLLLERYKVEYWKTKSEALEKELLTTDEKLFRAETKLLDYPIRVEKASETRDEINVISDNHPHAYISLSKYQMLEEQLDSSKQEIKSRFTGNMELTADIVELEEQLEKVMSLVEKICLLLDWDMTHAVSDRLSSSAIGSSHPKLRQRPSLPWERRSQTHLSICQLVAMIGAYRKEQNS